MITVLEIIHSTLTMTILYFYSWLLGCQWFCFLLKLKSNFRRKEVDSFAVNSIKLRLYAKHPKPSQCLRVKFHQGQRQLQTNIWTCHAIRNAIKNISIHSSFFKQVKCLFTQLTKYFQDTYFFFTSKLTEASQVQVSVQFLCCTVSVVTCPPRAMLRSPYQCLHMYCIVPSFSNQNTTVFKQTNREAKNSIKKLLRRVLVRKLKQEGMACREKCKFTHQSQRIWD